MGKTPNPSNARPIALTYRLFLSIAWDIFIPMDSDRSLERITRADLKRLARIAEEDRTEFFARHPEFAILYARRLLCTALAEESALHYLNGVTGIREFSVWSFYAEHPEAPFPVHRPARTDFGKSRFGRAPDAPEAYAGRPVELQGRSIDATPGDDPVEALQRYLKTGATRSARELAHKAVVLIAPDTLLGVEVWPTLALASPR